VDYLTKSASVSIGANSQIPPSRQITVSICDDQRDEFAETFLVRLTSASRFQLDPNQKEGRVTIQDNDPMPSLSISDLTVSEGDNGSRIARFPVQLSRASGKPVTVRYSTQGISGGALAGSSCTGPVDYVSVSNQELSFPAGVQTRHAEVQLCSDLVDGGNESFRVKLNSPTNATISDDTAQGTIRDDDNPVLEINNVSLGEPALGQSAQAAFTINLNAIVPDHDVTVHYQTLDGSARGGSSCIDESAPDYVSESGTARVRAGQSSTTINVQVCGNGSQILSRSFSVRLSNPSHNVPISDAVGTATITGISLNPIGDRLTLDR
jgi:hypothetical protein